MVETDLVTHVLMVAAVVAGGVGRHVQQLSAGLVERGHRVTVACPALVASRFDLAATGAQVVALEIGSRPAPHRDRRLAGQLAQTMEGVDVVHAHGLRAGGLAVLARDRVEPRPALVVTTHNAPPQGRLAAVAYRGLERMVCRRADLVLAVSEDLVVRANAAGAEVVERAVVPAMRATPTQSVGQIRAGLGMSDGQPLVVTVGRLSPQKGFDRLLEPEVAEVLRDHDALLVVAGDGPQAEALQRRIDTGDVPARLLGHRDDVPDLLAAADLAVSAARWEGQPVWLQEVLSVGTPVVATDVGGTAEVLDGAALLVPPEQPTALAEAIARVLADRDLAARMGRGSLARAAQLPTADDAVTAALSAYRRAAEAVSPGDVD